MVNETHILIDMVRKMYPVQQFFKDRYFPDGKTFFSEKVLIECKKGGRRVAPFVVPVVNGIRMDAEAYRGYELKAPYIAPKMEITAEDLEKKAFGEDPNTNRSPADRENEIEAEHMDDLRNSILRRLEQMSTELILTGKVVMKHYATAEDAAREENAKVMEYKFFDGDTFGNRYVFTKSFREMTAQEKIQEFYRMASVLRKRHVRASDIVMTADVSMLLMTDEKFLEFYNKRSVNTGEINQTETPDGVTANGTINVNGINFTLFTYDESFEDLDGTVREMLPKGTIAMLTPKLGRTAYAQVTFVKGDGHVSYAEKMIPRLVASETNNVVETQMFSRPVPYPRDWESWLVANIYEDVQGVETEPEGLSDMPDVYFKSEEEIHAMSRKDDLIAYGESIGITGLSSASSLAELRAAVIDYQNTHFAD